MLYITLEQAQEIHRNTVNVSGGGALGILDIGMLDIQDCSGYIELFQLQLLLKDIFAYFLLAFL